MALFPGDRVSLRVQGSDVGNEDYMWRGMTGTVLDEVSDDGAVYVEWDEDVGGNDCDGRCKEGCGWQVDVDDIELLSEKFRIGDLVALNCYKPDGNSAIKMGDIGTVVWIRDGVNIGVDWGKDVDGHDCEGHCEYGRGWNVNETRLTLVCHASEDKEFEQEDDSGLVELLFGKAV